MVHVAPRPTPFPRSERLVGKKLKEFTKKYLMTPKSDVNKSPPFLKEEDKDFFSPDQARDKVQHNEELQKELRDMIVSVFMTNEFDREYDAYKKQRPSHEITKENIEKRILQSVLKNNQDAVEYNKNNNNRALEKQLINKELMEIIISEK